MTCPKCGSNDIETQTFQENQGSVSSTKSLYAQKKHGVLWWICIGWWLWMIDLFIWIFLFVPRLIVQLCKKKKYVGKSTTATKNVITYKTVCTCKNCSYHWETK